MTSRKNKRRSSQTSRRPQNASGPGYLVARHSPARRSLGEGGSLATAHVIVKRSSVHGRGVFAGKAFNKGDRIIEYTGQRILWSSVPDELDDPRMYYFGIGDGKWVIDPSVGGNEAQWINHSCNPNCEIRETRGRIFIHALRKIRQGEELFYDYHLETDDDVAHTQEIKDEAPCYCKSKDCRGTLLA